MHLTVSITIPHAAFSLIISFQEWHSQISFLAVTTLKDLKNKKNKFDLSRGHLLIPNMVCCLLFSGGKEMKVVLVP